jgi:hypothetical protein
MSAHYAVNFTAATNADLAQAFALTDTAGAPVSLQAATMVMAIETTPAAPPLIADTANGRIAITDSSAGTFEIRIPAAALQAMPPGVYRHDLVITRSGRKTRIWSGHVTLEQGIAS